MPRLDDPGLYYETVGSGPPLLLMHGGLGLDHTYFRPWLDPLGELVELVYYDHRGNGRSERPDDWSELDHATWADDADRLREALGHETVTLLGHSYGAHLALEYALRHSERLDGLVLCSAAPAMDYPEVILDNLRRRGTEEQAEALTRGMSGEVRSDEEFREVWLTLLPLYFREYEEDIARTMDERTEYSGRAFHRSFIECLPDFDVTERLGEIDTPTLVLAGRYDWIMPPAQGATRLHRRIPGSELLIFEESGHFPFIEEPEAFVRVVGDWVKETRP